MRPKETLELARDPKLFGWNLPVVVIFDKKDKERFGWNMTNS